MALTFERYPTIDTFSEKIKMRCLRSVENWRAVEKIHGANYQFITNGDKVQSASRNRILTDEVFFNHREVFERYADVVRDNHRSLAVAGVINEGQTVRFFGELAGEAGGLKVQQNADYGALDFYLFDIVVDGRRLPYQHVLDAVGLKKAPIVASGTFADVIQHGNKFPTLVDGSCTCEGYILRCDASGEVYKFKNDLFVEKVVGSGLEHQYPLYVTENRVRAVLSKEGAFERQRFNDYIDLVKSDIEHEMKADGIVVDFDGKEKQLISRVIAAVGLGR
ncbi:RNA ligase family protein [Stenotrophomonas sp. S39]|uniref:RNA ligase family protein n=1 Tax=Stenotrophomonas sp. S39 TaxID=2767451 RepID=UPI00190CA5B7|nr:RNA ligase family protein [Stenotrophomonas sp. S39]MBK0052964.1 hypothetical protein [Stenotrophomonas sp. S39]